MPGLSKVIVLDPDARAGRQVQLGFEREGVPAAAISVDLANPTALDFPGDPPGGDVGLILVGGINGQGRELVRRTRALLADRRIDVPIMFAGRGIDRRDAEAAGADEVVQQPAYLRDVVTIGRLLRGQPSTQRGRLVGNLAEITGVFTLVRALATMGRSATLSLMRGLRRGEIRFFHGEVTSAQIGMIHGLAALHQLLLWTDARFDFHYEDIVRRQQIPLTHQELFADAERFLESVRESSGGLSPSMVLDQDVERVQMLGKQIPTEVFGVLRMFDGHRVLADVLEDSAYRVFETLRVAQRAVEAGLLRVVEKQAPRATWRTILSIEEWLVGSELPERVAESGPVRTQDTGPAARDPGLTTTRNQRGQRGQRGSNARKPRRKKRRKLNTPLATPVAAASPRPIDWGALVPRIIGAEVGPLAGVVPAAHVSGEIVSTTSPSALERNLPAAQPTIVFDEAADPARDARREAEREAERAAADPRAYADTARLAAVQAIEEPAAGEPAAEQPAPGEPAAGEPAAGEPAAGEPAAGNPAATEPAGEERGAAEPVVAERALGEPAAAEVRVQASAVAAEAEAHAHAVRVVAATVSLSSEPARVVDDLLLGDTKPERLVGRPKPGGASDVAVEEVAKSIGHDDPTEAAPAPVADEPSDGVIRHHITTAETAPAKRRRAPTEPPEDDRPEDTAGEITAPRARTPREPRMSEPSILVPDLAVIHAEVSAVASEQVTVPIVASAASPALEATVASTRADAVAFSDAEEAFFRAGHEKDAAHASAPPSSESFDDLDEGYRPVGFWDRLRGKALPRADTPLPPDLLEPRDPPDPDPGKPEPEKK